MTFSGPASIPEPAINAGDRAPAYFLPPDHEHRIARTEEVKAGGAELRVPSLNAADLEAIAAGLARSAVQSAPALSTSRRVRVLGRVAASWIDRTTSHRREAERLLPLATGYAPGMVAGALDRLFHSLEPPALEDLLRVEAEVLGRPAPRLVVLIAAGTVFPPAIAGATAALLLGAPVLIKPASAEPVLAALWAHSLAARDPELARLVAVLPWPRTRTDLTTAALGAAGTVLAYGDDETIAAIGRATPPTTHIVAHGHRVSAAILGARAVAGDAAGLARNLAADIALYDQEGCLSPHSIFIEETGAASARGFADLLARELDALAHAWPRAPLAPGAASSLRQFLLTAELGGRSVLGGIDAGWAIVIDSATDPAPRFEHSPLGRTVILKPVASVAAAIEALAPVRERLQAVGLAVSPAERLALDARLVLDNGEMHARLCDVGSMQSPPLTWAADGHRPLASLVGDRWVELC